MSRMSSDEYDEKGGALMLTVYQVAARLGITHQRVLKLIAAGRLPAVKFSRVWAIKEEDLDNFKKRAPGRPKKEKSQ